MGRFAAGLLSLCLPFAVVFSAQAHDRCYGPITGAVETSDYSFTYESWMKWQTRTKAYRFERCIRNNHSRELWVDWESTGLKGVTKPKDVSYKFFDAPRDNKKEEQRSLWYGPKPEEERPLTVLQQDEASLSFQKLRDVHLVQANAPDLGEAFSDPLSFKNYIDLNPELAKEQSVTLVSGGRIAIPTRANALEDLRDLNKEIGSTDFVPVEVFLSETLRLGDNGTLVSMVALELRVDEKEFAMMEKAGGNLPPISFEISDPELSKRLGEPGTVYESKSASLSYKDLAPAKLDFPVTRRSAVVSVRFGEDQAQIALPFGVMTPAQ